MIYDATKSGLNEAVWVPWFSLPTIDCQLRDVESDTLWLTAMWVKCF